MLKVCQKYILILTWPIKYVEDIVSIFDTF